LVLLEAMRARLPIVASAVGAIPELLSDGSGVLVPADDPVALSEAVVQLVLDDDAAARCVDAAAAALVGRFSPERMADAHVQLYDALVRKRPAIADD
jgi:starch synthase